MVFALIILLTVVVGLLVILHLSARNREDEKLFNALPGPPEIPFFGHAFSFIMGREKIFQYGRDLNAKYSISKIRFFNRKIVNVSHPDDVEVVMSSSKHNAKSFLYSFIRPWLEDGLLLSDGEKWHSRRKILTPAFHFNVLREFTKVLEENSKRLVDKLELELTSHKTSLMPIITDYTLQSICETSMGVRLDPNDESARKYKSAVHEVGECIIYRMARIWLTIPQIFALSSTGRVQKRVLAILKNFTKQVINERRDYSNRVGFADLMNDNVPTEGRIKRRRMAMLDLLLSAERDGVIDAAGIQEEVDTFMFEGHDTTMTSLVFTLLLLANHQDVQTKVYEECTKIMGDNDREATTSDLLEMKYLECCIKESLRLYPSVPFISRILGEETVLSGYKLPTDITCHIHIYDLHRNPMFWPEPNSFKPERFFKEEISERHHFIYVPFSAGPRNCIGQKFAMLELKSALSAIVRKFQILPVTKLEDVVFLADLILRARDPIYVRFRRRE